MPPSLHVQKLSVPAPRRVFVLVILERAAPVFVVPSRQGDAQASEDVQLAASREFDGVGPLVARTCAVCAIQVDGAVACTGMRTAKQYYPTGRAPCGPV